VTCERKEEDVKTGFSDETGQDFLNSIVDSVNQYRTKHGAPPVRLDPELVSYAKSRAEHVADKGELIHDGTQGYGENLSWQASSGPTLGSATGATDSWYNEVKDYNFKDLASNDLNKTGHFTQLVWKGSTTIGAGRVCGKNADSPWHETYIAMVFSPAGNMTGAYQANVSPPH
jgi:glioma pathogenesis-related protein 2